MKDLRRNVKDAFGFWMVFTVGTWLSFKIFHYYEVMGSMPWFYWFFGIMGLVMLVTGWYHVFQNVEIIATEVRRRLGEMKLINQIDRSGLVEKAEIHDGIDDSDWDACSEMRGNIMENSLINRCIFCNEPVEDRTIADCCSKRKAEVRPELWTYVDDE